MECIAARRRCFPCTSSEARTSTWSVAVCLLEQALHQERPDEAGAAGEQDLPR